MADRMPHSREEIAALVSDACGECLLHASYSIPAREFEATRFAARVILSGVRERLGLRAEREEAHATR